MKGITEGSRVRLATKFHTIGRAPTGGDRGLSGARGSDSRQARAVRRRASSAFGGAPTTVSTTWPSLKKRSVGMAWTP